MIKPPVRGPWMGNKDYVSREQGPWYGYRMGDAKYVASIKTENV